MTFDEARVTRPVSTNGTTLFDAMRQRFWLVVLVVAGFLVIGLFLIVMADEEYVATAEVIVRDPRAGTTAGGPDGAPTNISSERYLADQVEILESVQVAEVASDLLENEFSPRFILTRRTIEGSATSNVIEVQFRANSPEIAQTVTNTLVDSYLEVRRRQVQEAANQGLARVDALRDALDEELDEIRDRIDELSAGDTTRQELNAQIDESSARLRELRAARNEAPFGGPERERLNAQIDELVRDFTALETALRLEQQDPQLAPLLVEQESSIAERATLTALRNEIAVDAELAAGGVSLVSPAQLPTEPTGLGPELMIGGMLLLGLAVAAVLSYYLSLRRSVLTDKSMAEEVLDVPLLGEIPDMESADSITLPDTPPAESFRFIAAGVSVRAMGLGASLVLVTSPQHGAGTTGTVINTAIAAAELGLRVAIVDADFAKQSLRKAVGLPESAGMAEVVAGGALLREVIHEIQSSDSGSISILPSGSLSVGSLGFFSGAGASQLLRGLSVKYDLVLIDAPPLLEIAYTLNLAGHAEAVLMVVREGSSMESVRDAGSRLQFVGTPLLGYVYTHTDGPGRTRKQPGQAATARAEIAAARDEDATPSEEDLAV